MTVNRFLCDWSIWRYLWQFTQTSWCFRIELMKCGSLFTNFRQLRNWFCDFFCCSNFFCHSPFFFIIVELFSSTFKKFEYFFSLFFELFSLLSYYFIHFFFFFCDFNYWFWWRSNHFCWFFAKSSFSFIFLL